jgi:hypothetical protein
VQFVFLNEHRMQTVPEMNLPLTHVKLAVSVVQVMHGETHGGAVALLS